MHKQIHRYPFIIYWARSLAQYNKIECYSCGCTFVCFQLNAKTVKIKRFCCRVECIDPQTYHSSQCINWTIRQKHNSTIKRSQMHRIYAQCTPNQLENIQNVQTDQRKFLLWLCNTSSVRIGTNILVIEQLFNRYNIKIVPYCWCILDQTIRFVFC